MKWFHRRVYTEQDMQERVRAELGLRCAEAYARGYAIGRQDGATVQLRHDAESMRLLEQENAALSRDVEIITRVAMETLDELERRR